MFMLILLVAVSFLFYKLFFVSLTTWKQKGVKHIKPVPFFGNLFRNAMQREAIALFSKRIYDAFPNERYCGLYQLQMPVLMIRDPDLIKRICISEFDKFRDHQTISSDADTLWSKNLVASRGQHWHDLRSTLSPVFTGSKMRTMFGLMNDCGEKFVDYFLEMDKDVITLEMKEVFSRFANDVIATCAFGVQVDSLRQRENEFYVQGLRLTDFSGIKQMKFFAMMYYPKLMGWLNVRIFSESLGNFFKTLIKESISLREEKGITRPDLIQILLEASKTDKRGVLATEEDITAQAMVFFFAGFETVSTEMSFMFYELALNPDVQEKLRGEIDEAVSNCSGKLSYDVVMKIKYLEMVISETLRKWPANTFTDRISNTSFTIEPTLPHEKPLELEAGSRVWIPQYALQRDPQYYPEPEKFDPERFSDENKAKIDPAVYIPFGMGPRICIGNRFALMEMKILTTMILSRFEIVPVRKTPVPFVFSTKHFQPYAEGGIFLGFKRR